MSEAGLSGYEVNSWYGLLGPAGLSKDIVQRLNAEVIRSMAEPDARERLYSIGAEPMSNTPDEFAAYIRSEMAKWAKVVKAAGIRAE
jgi:tripartite-type tricarboxylate transporter receptor subunit TctC